MNDAADYPVIVHPPRTATSSRQMGLYPSPRFVIQPVKLANHLKAPFQKP
jgi:hypothetical protein